jgi:hypothetical protein
MRKERENERVTSGLRSEAKQWGGGGGYPKYLYKAFRFPLKPFIPG